MVQELLVQLAKPALLSVFLLLVVQ